eukprot:366308-Chlamydomonas_euryale.AAC.3
MARLEHPRPDAADRRCLLADPGWQLTGQRYDGFLCSRPPFGHVCRAPLWARLQCPSLGTSARPALGASTGPALSASATPPFGRVCRAPFWACGNVTVAGIAGCSRLSKVIFRRTWAGPTADRVQQPLTAG